MRRSHGRAKTLWEKRIVAEEAATVAAELEAEAEALKAVEKSIKDAETDWVVKNIVGRGFEDKCECDPCCAPGVVHYRVQWEGYNPRIYNSWEPAHNLNCRKLIAAFEAKFKSKAVPKVPACPKRTLTITDERANQTPAVKKSKKSANKK